MGCTHTSGCPLFPKLNASLRGWRDAYCDSGSGWQSCARYRLSLTGQPVPLTLLPNGRDAQALIPAGGPRSRFAARRVVLDAEADSPFERVPTPRPRPRPAPVVTPRPRSATTVAVAPVAVVPELVRPVLPGRTGWWTRLVEWLRGPA